MIARYGSFLENKLHFAVDGISHTCNWFILMLLVGTLMNQVQSAVNLFSWESDHRRKKEATIGKHGNSKVYMSVRNLKLSCTY